MVASVCCLSVRVSAADTTPFIRTFTSGLTLTSISLGELLRLSRLKLRRPSSCHCTRRSV
jgi:hypothetical protein